MAGWLEEEKWEIIASFPNLGDKVPLALLLLLLLLQPEHSHAMATGIRQPPLPPREAVFEKGGREGGEERLPLFFSHSTLLPFSQAGRQAGRHVARLLSCHEDTPHTSPSGAQAEGGKKKKKITPSYSAPLTCQSLSLPAATRRHSHQSPLLGSINGSSLEQVPTAPPDWMRVNFAAAAIFLVGEGGGWGGGPHAAREPRGQPSCGRRKQEVPVKTQRAGIFHYFFYYL